jgi:glucose-1-phosphate thymidylyltransferase
VDAELEKYIKNTFSLRVMIKQAVVLAAGLGSRMQKALDDQSLTLSERESIQKGLKGMILGLDNRPIFDSTVQNLIDAGIKKIIFVVNSVGGHMIKEYYGHKIGSVKVDYALQKEQLGTANAIASAKDAVGDDKFMILFYDNVYPEEAIRLLVHSDAEWGAIGFDRSGLENPELCNMRKEKIRQCAVMSVNSDYELQKIIERPGAEQDNYPDPEGRILINMGLFAFDKKIFECCDKVPPVERHPGKKEYEIQPAVQYGIDNLGIKMKVIPFYGGVLDLTALEDVPGAKEFTRDRKLSF